MNHFVTVDDLGAGFDLDFGANKINVAGGGGVTLPISIADVSQLPEVLSSRGVNVWWVTAVVNVNENEDVAALFAPFATMFEGQRFYVSYGKKPGGIYEFAGGAVTMPSPQPAQGDAILSYQHVTGNDAGGLVPSAGEMRNVHDGIVLGRINFPGQFGDDWSVAVYDDTYKPVKVMQNLNDGLATDYPYIVVDSDIPSVRIKRPSDPALTSWLVTVFNNSPNVPYEVIDDATGFTIYKVPVGQHAQFLWTAEPVVWPGGTEFGRVS